MGVLCRYCSPLLTEHEWTLGPIDHHPTIKALFGSAQSCEICRFVQERCDLAYLQQRFPELKDEESELLPLQLRVASFTHRIDAPSWLLLSGRVSADKQNFELGFKVTLTTCGPGSTSSPQKRHAQSQNPYSKC
jgi:hypothetical protein